MRSRSTIAVAAAASAGTGAAARIASSRGPMRGQPPRRAAALAAARVVRRHRLRHHEQRRAQQGSSRPAACASPASGPPPAGRTGRSWRRTAGRPPRSASAPGRARALAWPRVRSVSCTAVRARSIVSRTARRCPRACASQARRGGIGCTRPAGRPPAGPWRGTRPTRRGGPGGTDACARSPSSAAIAHRHPAANRPPSISASAGSAARPVPARAPRRAGCRPAASLAPDPGEGADEDAEAGQRHRHGRPCPRNSPNPAVISAPSTAKASRAGSRRRIGPPASHRQVSSAPSAASSSAASAATRRPRR